MTANDPISSIFWQGLRREVDDAIGSISPTLFMIKALVFIGVSRDGKQSIKARKGRIEASTNLDLLYFCFRSQLRVAPIGFRLFISYLERRQDVPD